MKLWNGKTDRLGGGVLFLNAKDLLPTKILGLVNKMYGSSLMKILNLLLFLEQLRDVQKLKGWTEKQQFSIKIVRGFTKKNIKEYKLHEENMLRSVERK